MNLDTIDKKIIQHLSAGTNSYEQLAKQCGVTRNTIYRRITALENKGIIKNTIRCTVNFDHLDITPIIFGAKVPINELDKTLNLLTAHKNVRFLWRTYGQHTVALVAFCTKGNEGELIQSINAIFESLNVNDVSVSTGFVWEKMDFAPFNEEISIEAIANIIEERV
ncbi:MAG: Lrp/AsnC family transcriptional regulator [Candidatus Bathyarchaeota archaeon]|nr:Lrp/AsnC family transcriptional regulator [Candidatus Bathyarchaeota archaeon]